MPKKSYQVPFTAGNNTGADLVLVITNFYVAYGTASPVDLGINSVCEDAGQTTCGTVCSSYPKTSQVCVPDGTSGLSFEVVSGGSGDSANTSAAITVQWVDAATCTPVGAPQTTSGSLSTTPC